MSGTQPDGTLLYTPGVKALVFVSATNTILDLTDDIESGNLTLNENNPHSLNMTLSNLNGKYGGVFTPNDKIVVQMRRLNWLQVFAGYLDEVPYFQVLPGSINLSATCTLKRLKFHFWDPNYQEVIDFIAQAFQDGYGSDSTSATQVPGPGGQKLTVPAGDILSAQGLQSQTDSGMKSVLINIMTQIIGWNKSNIHIGAVPSGWINALQPIWNDLQIAITNEIMSVTAQAAASSIGTGATVAGINVGSGMQWTAADWASALIIAAGGVASSNNVSNVLHWMAAESGSTFWTRNDPLNVGAASGSYSTLWEAIVGSAQNEGTAGVIQQQNMSAILQALQNPGTSLDAFAAAVVSTPWCANNGGPGGQYYNLITTSSPDPSATAPVASGPVQGIPSADFLTNGQATASSSSATQSGAASATSQVTTNLLNQTPIYQTTTGTAGATSSSSQSGTTGGTGPQQAPGVAQAVAYAAANWDTNPNNQDIGSGNDCSAFTAAAWAAGGVQLPHNAQAQYDDPQVVIVDISQIQAGDLLFEAGKGSTTPIGHVAIYGGNNTVYQHDGPGNGKLTDWVNRTDAQGGPFYGVGRVTPNGTNNGTNPKPNTAVSPSAAAIAAGANAAGGTTGNPAANGLNGAVIYGTGQWEPASAPADPYASAFQGLKALMLDTGIMPYISDICNASLRNYCAAPNGDFIAWFPDYFGQYGMAATWHLSLIEVEDFDIYWSDNNLITHQYVAGSLATDNESIDPSNGDSISYGGDSASPSELAAVTSYGVATIDMPGLLEAVTGVNPGDPGIYGNVNQIYEQFGARPNMCSLPTVSAPSLAAFWFAVRIFQENWANQFNAEVKTTFMPELFPGMLLAIDELQFQCYITSVTHSWNFQDGVGFSTSVNVIAPSTTGGGGTGAASANSAGGLLGLARGGPGTPG